MVSITPKKPSASLPRIGSQGDYTAVYQDQWLILQDIYSKFKRLKLLADQFNKHKGLNNQNLLNRYNECFSYIKGVNKNCQESHTPGPTD